MRLISKLLAVLALAATSATQGGNTVTRELVLENQGQTAGRLSADTPSSLADAAPAATRPEQTATLARPAAIPPSAWQRMMHTIAQDQRRARYAVRAVSESEGTDAGGAQGDVLFRSRSPERGIEQGFTIDTRPAGAGELRVEMRLLGRLEVELDADGLGASFVDGSGEPALRYAGLAAWDAAGRALDAKLAMDEAAQRLAIVVDDAGAAYPVTIDPLFDPLGLELELKLTASDAQAGDYFGLSVAISGDTAIVAARRRTAGSFAGAAYIFERDDGGADNWGEVTKLTASDAQVSDLFGISVAISGDTAIVGAYGEDEKGSDAGAAYIFERDDGGADNWGQVTKLTASDAQTSDFFGEWVAISGDTAIVGASGEDEKGSGAGAAYIFERDEGGADNWGEVTKLTASDAQALDEFGRVAISGDTAIVGARFEDEKGFFAGAAYIFERDEGGADNWGEVTKLTASDAQDNDYFGHSVAISGDTAIVGAPDEAEKGSKAGAAYIFERDEGGADNWGEVTKLTASDAQDNDYFGYSVAINLKPQSAARGDRAIVGARGEAEKGSDAGAAYIFERDEGGADNWGEVTKLTASDAQTYDYFGHSVAISGDTAIVGAPDEAEKGSKAGAAYIFERDEGGADNWGEVTKLTASDAQTYDYFGHSVAISGDTAIVGARYEDEKGNDAGAAYIYDANQAPVADAGSNQTVNANLGTATVTLDGSGSSDREGDPLIFTWTGPFGTAGSVSPTVTLPGGVHTITLTVDDGKGGVDTDTVTITVRALEVSPKSLSFFFGKSHGASQPLSIRSVGGRVSYSITRIASWLLTNPRLVRKAKPLCRH